MSSSQSRGLETRSSITSACVSVAIAFLSLELGGNGGPSRPSLFQCRSSLSASPQRKVSIASLPTGYLQRSGSPALTSAELPAASTSIQELLFSGGTTSRRDENSPTPP